MSTQGSAPGNAHGEKRGLLCCVWGKGGIYKETLCVRTKKPIQNHTETHSAALTEGQRGDSGLFCFSARSPKANDEDVLFL